MTLIAALTVELMKDRNIHQLATDDVATREHHRCLLISAEMSGWRDGGQ